MKIILPLLIFQSLSLFYKAQNDAIKIGSAKKAYDNNEFRLAIDELNQVSDKYRNNKVFLYYKGNSHYELKEYDSAKVYLKKYLLVDTKNEGSIAEVAEKLSTIDYEIQKKIKEDEERNEKLRAAELAIKLAKEAALKKEEDKFQSCKGSNDIYCFRSYLKLYPSGLHSEECKIAISNIEEQNYKATYRNGTIASYTSFLSLYPNSKYENEAKQNLKNLQERKRQKETFLAESNKFLSLSNENQNEIIRLKSGRKVYTVLGFMWGGFASFWLVDPIRLFDEQVYRTLTAAPMAFGSIACFGAVTVKSVKIIKQKKQKKINYEKYQDLKSKAEGIQVY